MEINKKSKVLKVGSYTLATTLMSMAVAPVAQAIQHDAEFYVVQKQHAKEWKAEDQEIDAKLKALKDKYGKRPNIIHIMWDDTGVGDMGSPLFNKIRGYDTPNINKMAKEGVTFARMYTEPSSTPTRAAALTGRLPIRTGMFKVLFPPDDIGLPGEEVTIAEVLSKSGYKTGFFGKAHQGVIKESYPQNQGFDEALTGLYNQWGPMMWNASGEAAGYSIGWEKDSWDKKYALDEKFRPYDYIMAIDAKKGDRVIKEWGRPSVKNYFKLENELVDRSIKFIRQNVKDNKPFYMAYWPNIPGRPVKQPGEKFTTSTANFWAEAFVDLDKKIGLIRNELISLGISENTLVILMADNGPMEEIAPSGPFSMFRGGKGSVTEGGIRVPAFGWWPGTIKPETVVGDIVHVSDLYTTFAKIGGGTRYIPTDRVVDGINQTALLLNGDAHGRRDYNIVYAGNILGAITKQQFKRHMLSDRPGLVGKSFYNLYWDPREEHLVMAEIIWAWGNFDMMIQRHQKLMKKYKNTPPRRGKPYEGIVRVEDQKK